MKEDQEEKRKEKKNKEITLDEYRKSQKERKRNILQIIVDSVEYFFLWLFSKIGLGFFVKWYVAHSEGMRYLVMGALATVVNIAVYDICYYLVNIPNAISNCIAWVVAAVFAYFTNKMCVFITKTKDKKDLLREVTSFFGARLVTLGFDELIMIITVDVLNWNAGLMKIVANIVVIILNFIFSKLFIFKQDKKEGKGK